ncbi:uncharacterized protein M6G45_001066 isoform 2-T2 [Spheniscus humboldti]
MNCTLSSVDSVSCNGSLGSYHSIFLLLSYLEVGFAAGTVLTMRKQLHPTLRGQDHALTRNHLRSPSKKGHFQHRSFCCTNLDAQVVDAILTRPVHYQ